jgi:hypothetical protein
MRTSILLLTLLLALSLSIQGSLANQNQATPTPAGSNNPRPSATPEQSEGEENSGIQITSPQAGQALQGNVPVQGKIDAQSTRSTELSFAYANGSTETWFLIQAGLEPGGDRTLAHWDTTTITDGQYDLRLTVTLNNGRQVSTTIEGLRVRNYTPVETNTPAPTSTPAPGELPTATLTPTSTPTEIPPTPTPMPTNPAQLTASDITSGLGKGALGVAAAFVLIGLYAGVKRLFRR